MLVEDDCDDREIFLCAVHDFYPSVDCIIAENGEEAIEILISQKNLPQLIFLDLNMPKMNGFQFLEEIKAHENLTQLTIVVVSTSSDQRTISETKALGAKGFVTKPNSMADWKEQIKSVLINQDILVL